MKEKERSQQQNEMENDYSWYDFHKLPADSLGHDCWRFCKCDPEIVFIDETTGQRVWLHKEIH